MGRGEAAVTGPLVLGLDTQPTRLGVALVTLGGEPAPVWADTFPLRRPGVTLGHAVRDVVRRASAEAERAGGEVVRVGIERAIIGGKNTSLETCWDSGGVYALARDGCQRVWKGRKLLIVSLRVGEWKMLALGKGHGNATKDQVAVWARRLAAEAGWDEIRMNGLAERDATDAVGIGVGAAKKGGAA